jgi:hypothetical protein
MEARIETQPKTPLHGGFQAMLVLLIATYVGVPFLGTGMPASVILVGGTCATMLIGIRTARCQGPFFPAGAVLAVGALATHGMCLGTDVLVWNRVMWLLVAALVLLAIVAILMSVMRATRVDADKIMGAICALFLIGLFWSFLYQFIDSVDPDSFDGSGHDHAHSVIGGPRQAELLYFSFVTMTTLGYGDIVPTNQLTRALATMEALAGQLYLAVLVARLVALHIVHSVREEE